MPAPDDLLKQKLGAISAGRVLDVATGHGEFVELLVQFLAGYEEIVGIDTSAKCLAGARTLAKHERVNFVEMDADRMIYPDAAFDTVALSNSLHHLRDMPHVLEEMRRVLKPGGRFIIQEMYQDNQSAPQMSHVMLHHWCAEIDRLRGECHDPTMTRAQILGVIQGLNLSETDIFDLDYTSEVSNDDKTRAWLERQIDKALELVPGKPERADLIRQGAAVRQQIQTHGFAPASRLFVIGRKPA